MTTRIQIIVDIQLSDNHKNTLDTLGIDYSTPFEAKITEALTEMIDVLEQVLAKDDLPIIRINPVGLIG